jgi:hypothetical protein
MLKKSTTKPRKTTRTSTTTTANTGNAKVIDLVAKLEKKVEKQLAGFVKEIVRLKKAQEQLNKKVTQTPKTTKTQSTATRKKAKRRTTRKLAVA